MTARLIPVGSPAADPNLIPLHWRLPARLTFVGVALLAGVVLVGGLLEYYRQLTTICATAACVNSPTLGDVETYRAAGLSIEAAARWGIGLHLLAASVFSAVALLIFWRRSSDRMAWYTALALLTFGTIGIVDIAPLTAVAQQFAPVWQVTAVGLWLAGSTGFTLFFFIFPNGRFEPRWLGWVAGAWTVSEVLTAVFPGSVFDNKSWPALLSLLYWFSLLGLSVYAQLYQYHRVSNYQRRQQTKWVVLGVALAATGSLASYALFLLAPLINPAWAVLGLLGDNIYFLILPLVPLSIAFALLRSRLWDVDVLINRALVYGVLTVLLAGIYGLLVIGLQALFTQLTGQTSDLALIGSTLAIVALFQPLRRGVSAFIARRFYRRHYDGQQVLTAFAGVLRDQPYTDPDALSRVLLNLVDDTIQPEHVSLRLVDAAGQQAVPGAPSKPGG